MSVLNVSSCSMRQAFGINVYNLMVKYAFVKVGTGDTDYNRFIFYNNVSFQLGGHVYNLQDWENGILRGNRKAPYALSLQFGKTDPRLAYAIHNPTCRIHFALNFGTRSCPAVSFYTPENLEEELRLAALFFFEDAAHLAMDAKRYELKLNKIFAWYKVDFVTHVREYPQRLLQFLQGVKKQELERIIESAKKNNATVKVVFTPYDWSSINAKQIDTFDMQKLKTTEKRSLVKSILFPAKRMNGKFQREESKPSTIRSTNQTNQKTTNCSGSNQESATEHDSNNDDDEQYGDVDGSLSSGFDGTAVMPMEAY